MKWYVLIMIMVKGKEKVSRNEENAIVITIPFYELKSVVQEWIKECQADTADVQSTNQAKYLTRAEAAKVLHVSLVTLDSYIKAGILPAKRIGIRVLISEEALNSALQSITAKTNKVNN